MSSVAALFVQSRGVYFGIPGVDQWDLKCDAPLPSGIGFPGPNSLAGFGPFFLRCADDR